MSKEKNMDKSFYYKKNGIGLLPKLSQKGKDGLKSSSYIKWHRIMSNGKDKSKSFWHSFII